MHQLVVLLQDAVDRRLRSDEDLAFREDRDDLIRRLVPELRSVHNLEDLGCFGRRELVPRDRVRALSPVLFAVEPPPPLECPSIEANDPAGVALAGTRDHGLMNKGADHSPLLSSVGASASPQISRTFFWSSSKAFTARIRLSFRATSCSRALIRFSSASRSPLRRRKAPSSASGTAAASRITCSFSAAVHCLGLFACFESPPLLVVIGVSVGARRSQRESVFWLTPTSLASAQALIAPGIARRSTIRLRKPSVYFTIRSAPPNDFSRSVELFPPWGEPRPSGGAAARPASATALAQAAALMRQLP